MTPIEYWTEALQSSFKEHNIDSTSDNLVAIAKDMWVAQKQFSMAFYQPENPMILEVETLRRQLAIERSKEVCPECKGRGYITENFAGRSSTSGCLKCNREGYLVP